MKRVLLFLCLGAHLPVSGQVSLSGTSYTQHFDNLVQGMPLGWTIRTGATSTSLGENVSASLIATPSAEAIGASGTYWKNITGGFKNFASYTPALEGKTVDQANATNRALGIRQSSRLGDPGAAFVVQINNTQGFRNFQLSFWLQSLDNSNGERQTTWTVDFALGNNPTNFTPLATGFMTGNNTYSNSQINLALSNIVDNQGQTLWIRIVTLAASTNPSNASNPTRTSSAIDDFSLTYQTMPTPISLLYFKAEMQQQRIKLWWETATEYQNDYFEVERSQDLQVYESIGIIKGKENASTVQYYDYEDYFPLEGLSYYRLCQIDLNKQRACFRPVGVELSKTNSVQAFPNPVKPTQTMVVVAEEVAMIWVHTMNGNLINIDFRQARLNTWETIIPESLGGGVYFLVILKKDGTRINLKIWVE